MPTLDVDGDRLHFTDDGTGTPVIFVHGSCGGAGQWKAMAAGLTDNHRTVCLDLFGSGQSQPWPIERVWTAEDDERAISAVLDRLGEPAHFVIHSGAGHFAYPTIKNRNHDVRSLTLFEPVYFNLLRETGDPLFAEPEQIANRFREAMDNNDLDGAMEGFVDSWAGVNGAWASLPDAIKAMMKIGSNRLYHEWKTNLHDEPSRQDLMRLETPALLFKGSRTIKSMHRVCELIRQHLPACDYMEVEGAGHMSPFTHVSAVLPAVKAHLAACDR
ncbi:alpha/beta fold hydrolase [Hoeflea sp.]|uniref:alpha/beta fold hydrolase n=1 Tax=Hoeflea sp. TaxID=1940281 RepID=UPI003B02A31B